MCAASPKVGNIRNFTFWGVAAERRRKCPQCETTARSGSKTLENATRNAHWAPQQWESQGLRRLGHGKGLRARHGRILIVSMFVNWEDLSTGAAASLAGQRKPILGSLAGQRKRVRGILGCIWGNSTVLQPPKSSWSSRWKGSWR